MYTRFAAIAAAATLAMPAFGKDFTIGSVGPAASRQATVESVTSVETFTGKTNNVTGLIKADPKTKVGSGWLEIDVASIDTGIPTRNEHMKSPTWLDTAKFPKARFQATKVAPNGTDKFSVAGKFTLHGITRSVTAPVTARYIKKSAASTKAGFPGDVIQLDAQFDIKLSDYGVARPGRAAASVNETVTIRVTAIAAGK